MSKHLLIDPETALETVAKLDEHDLLVQKLSEEKYLVLRDGVHIAKYLNCLVDNYGCKVAFLWDHKEEEQVKLYQNLDQACKEKGLKGFPLLAGMAVRDSSLFKGFKSENPMVVKSHAHKITIAGYENNDDSQKCMRDALSKILDIGSSDRNNHVVLEYHSSAVNIAKQEGWDTYDLSSLTLREAICDLYKKMTKSQHSQKFEGQDHVQYIEEVPKKTLDKKKSWNEHLNQRKWFIGNYLELSDMIEASKSLKKCTLTF